MDVWDERKIVESDGEEFVGLLVFIFVVWSIILVGWVKLIGSGCGGGSGSLMMFMEVLWFVFLNYVMKCGGKEREEVVVLVYDIVCERIVFLGCEMVLVDIEGGKWIGMYIFDLCNIVFVWSYGVWIRSYGRSIGCVFDKVFDEIFEVFLND